MHVISGFFIKDGINGARLIKSRTEQAEFILRFADIIKDNSLLRNRYTISCNIGENHSGEETGE